MPVFILILIFINNSFILYNYLHVLKLSNETLKGVNLVSLVVSVTNVPLNTMVSVSMDVNLVIAILLGLKR